LWPLTGWRKAPLIVAKIISSVKKGVYHTRRFQQAAQDDEMRRTLQDETTNGDEHSNMTKILPPSKAEPTGKPEIERRVRVGAHYFSFVIRQSCFDIILVHH